MNVTPAAFATAFPAVAPMLSSIAIAAVLLGGCGGGPPTVSEAPEGYGVTSNVGTAEEDLLQNESPDQDPFVANPDPIPD